VTTRLHLYSVFHANLKFSSIPEDHYRTIVDRCFWPVINLLDEFPEVQLGFEFPGETLEILQKLEPELVEAVGERWRSGRCEVLGSGYAQVIFPLAPAAVNARNLELGDEAYELLLGRRPTVAYVNEQTYSQGLLGLYAERGYRAFVADWDNTVTYNRYPSSYRYFPQTAVGGDSKLPVLWNSSIAFQKFQRYLGGVLDLEGYVEYLGDQWSADEDRAFVLYGNDWEIIDYQPGVPPSLRASTARPDLDRLRRLLQRLGTDGRFSVVAPSRVLDRFPPRHEVRLESAEYPIPCKKQDKYNVTRWAVCGREATLMNTQCQQLAQASSVRTALLGDGHAVPDAVTSALDRRLVSLWGSDYRTFTTQEKYVEFRNGVGAALAEVGHAIDQTLAAFPDNGELRFYNPNRVDWEGVPHEFKAEFRKGEVNLPVHLSMAGRQVPTQLEDVALWPDGSVKRARVIVCPMVPARDWAGARFVSGPTSSSPAEAAGNAVSTDSVRAVFNPARGATLAELTFPSVGGRPLAATLPHGYFESVGLSPDWYTGGVIIFDQHNHKYTDLVPTELFIPRPEDLEGYPVCIPVRCRIDLPVGTLWKTINVYRDAPRLDITYHFRFHDLQPHSVRLGIVTVNPRAFKRESIQYITVNGGRDPERFDLAGRRVTQDEPVSLNVSSRQCLGATEGWVAISDGTSGLAVMSNKAECYSVPLIHYEEVENSYFLRIYTSIAESDETAAQLWRGHSRITLRFMGYRDEGVPRRESVCMNRPLVTLSECSRSD